jgi:hypothetical protein
MWTLTRMSVVVLVATCYFGAAQAQTTLTAPELKALVSGKTWSATNERGQHYTETFRRDGRLFARSTRVGGSCCISDDGVWKVHGDELCRTYRHWRGHKELCTTVEKTGSGYKTSEGRSVVFENIFAMPQQTENRPKKKPSYSSAGSCSAQNAKCTAYCGTVMDHNSGCYGDCGSRMSACIANGCYFWKNSPTVCHLRRS